MGEEVRALISRGESLPRNEDPEPVTPGELYHLRIELPPMSFLARAGNRIRLEISNQDPLIADAPMPHGYGQNGGTGTDHHGGAPPSALHLQQRPRDGAAS